MSKTSIGVALVATLWFAGGGCGGDSGQGQEAIDIAELAFESTYRGCFTDAPDRALPVYLGPYNTAVTCLDNAYLNGLKYAGLQWYGECWGGDSLGYQQVAESECNTPCSADPSEICGGGYRNSVYELPVDPILDPEGYEGCFVDAPERALPHFFGNGHTVESCRNAVSTEGLIYMGVQAGGECWGGDSIGYEHVGDGECDWGCYANPYETCGGGWRNSIFRVDP